MATAAEDVSAGGSAGTAAGAQQVDGGSRPHRVNKTIESAILQANRREERHAAELLEGNVDFDRNLHRQCPNRVCVGFPF
jgi:hypothetical protein